MKFKDTITERFERARQKAIDVYNTRNTNKKVKKIIFGTKDYESFSIFFDSCRVNNVEVVKVKKKYFIKVVF